MKINSTHLTYIFQDHVFKKSYLVIRTILSEQLYWRVQTKSSIPKTSDIKNFIDKAIRKEAIRKEII